MKEIKDKQSLIIVALTVIILCMSIGFAVYSRTLNINGDVKLKGSKWSVHFVPESYTKKAGSVDEESVTPTTTTLTYSVSLNNPGDEYSYYIDVINDGILRAQLASVTTTTLTPAQAKYLEISMTYNPDKNSSTYIDLESGTKVLETPTMLDPEAEGRLNVSIKYKDNVPSEDLPEEDQTINLVTNLNYIQGE